MFVDFKVLYKSINYVLNILKLILLQFCLYYKTTKCFPDRALSFLTQLQKNSLDGQIISKMRTDATDVFTIPKSI